MRVAGIILCGGQSTRMGQDKAALMWQGRSWLDHAADTLRAAQISDIRVSGDRAGYRSLPDMIEGRGPLAAICSCVLQIDEDSEALLFVPVDMPLLTAGSLQALCGGLGSAQAAAFGDMPLPVCLRLDERLRRRCHDLLAEIADGNKGAVKAFLAGLVLNRLTAAHPDQLRNFNRPEDITGPVG